MANAGIFTRLAWRRGAGLDELPLCFVVDGFAESGEIYSASGEGVVAVSVSHRRGAPGGRVTVTLAHPKLDSRGAPAPKSQTPTLVASLLGDLGFPAPTEDNHPALLVVRGANMHVCRAFALVASYVAP